MFVISRYIEMIITEHFFLLWDMIDMMIISLGEMNDIILNNL